MTTLQRAARSIALSPSLTFPAVDAKVWGARFLVAALCLGSLLALTASRIEATKLRYQINTLYERREAARADIARLETELSSILRPQRVEASWASTTSTPSCQPASAGVMTL